MDAVDALSCHLHSTFSALSSSLALSSLKYPHRSEHAQVHLLILLGPSLFRPRSRIILTIDGLKTQACNRETEIGGSAHSEDENQCYNTGSTLNRVRRLDHARLLLSSLPPPASDPGRESDPSSPKHTENDTSSDPKNSPDPPSPLDETFTTYLEEQRILSAAERLLSRSLAIACAEDGVTLNAELGLNHFPSLEDRHLPCTRTNSDACSYTSSTWVSSPLLDTEAEYVAWAGLCPNWAAISQGEYQEGTCRRQDRRNRNSL